MSEKHRPRDIRRLILQLLGKIGIRVQFLLIVREGLRDAGAPLMDGDYASGFLTQSAIPQLLELESDVSAGELRKWLEEGRLCFGVWHGTRLVGRTWCDLKQFNFPPLMRDLDKHEAYLFAAYCDPAYRGRNLAPSMRAACYEALKTLGRTRFYSYTDYFNKPARRFKEKLGARNEALLCHMAIGGFSRTFVVKRYPNP